MTKWFLYSLTALLLIPVATSWSQEKKVVDFEAEVLMTFNQEHDLTAGTNSLASLILQTANVAVESSSPNGGCWLKLMIPTAVVLQTLLPPHKHGGKETLIPSCGKSVQATAKRLQKLGESYSKENSVCFKTIEHFTVKKKVGTLFFSTHPILFMEDYSGMEAIWKKHPGRLVHLDGLHRLLALSLMKDRPEQVEAYVAVVQPGTVIEGLGTLSCDVEERADQSPPSSSCQNAKGGEINPPLL